MGRCSLHPKRLISVSAFGCSPILALSDNLVEDLLLTHATEAQGVGVGRASDESRQNGILIEVWLATVPVNRGRQWSHESTNHTVGVYKL